MKRTLVALMVVFAGCAPNPAQNVPAATVSTPTRVEVGTPVATPAGDAVRYLVEPTTSKVAWTASKVTRSHEGGFKKFQGEISVAGGDPTTAAVNVDIDTDSIFSDEEKLTGHLKSEDFFDVAKFPKASFKTTKVAKAGEGFELTGDLALHGVTKSITFPANVTVAPEAVTAKAEFAINRMDFGIKYPGKVDDLIRSEVVIKLDLNAPVSK